MCWRIALIPRDGTTPETVIVKEVIRIRLRLVLWVAKGLDLIVVQHNYAGDMVAPLLVRSSKKTREFLFVRQRIHIEFSSQLAFKSILWTKSAVKEKERISLVLNIKCKKEKENQQKCFRFTIFATAVITEGNSEGLRNISQNCRLNKSIALRNSKEQHTFAYLRKNRSVDLSSPLDRVYQRCEHRRSPRSLPSVAHLNKLSKWENNSHHQSS